MNEPRGYWCCWNLISVSMHRYPHNDALLPDDLLQGVDEAVDPMAVRTATVQEVPLNFRSWLEPYTIQNMRRPKRTGRLTKPRRICDMLILLLPATW